MKVINVQESLITDNPYVLIKKAIWDFNNIYNTNDELIYNSIKKTFPKGYWTFDLIKKEFESYGNVTLEFNKYDRTCTLTSDCSINLKNFGPIPGFTKGGKVNINQGLKYIKIPCNIVD